MRGKIWSSSFGRESNWCSGLVKWVDNIRHLWQKMKDNKKHRILYVAPSIRRFTRFQKQALKFNLEFAGRFFGKSSKGPPSSRLSATFALPSTLAEGTARSWAWTWLSTVKQCCFHYANAIKEEFIPPTSQISYSTIRTDAGFGQVYWKKIGNSQCHRFEISCIAIMYNYVYKYNIHIYM